MIAVDGINFGLHGRLPVWVGVGCLKCKMIGLLVADGVIFFQVKVGCEVLEMSRETTYVVGSSKVVRRGRCRRGR